MGVVEDNDFRRVPRSRKGSWA